MKVSETSNEITAIPRLLQILEIQGCIVTIDAMGIQPEIAQKIIEEGGDYILGLKKSQGSIYQDVKQLFDWWFKGKLENIPHEAFSTIDRGHGQIELQARWKDSSLYDRSVEIRRYWLLSSVDHLIDAQLWSGFQGVGLVESERRIEGQPPTIEQRYYLLSLENGVERFAQAVRSHWCMENQLHWCFDVAFNEDDSRKDLPASICSGHASKNMTLIRHIALNLLLQETSFKAGMKAKRQKAGWDNDYLNKVLAG